MTIPTSNAGRPSLSNAAAGQPAVGSVTPNTPAMTPTMPFAIPVGAPPQLRSLPPLHYRPDANPFFLQPLQASSPYAPRFNGQGMPFMPYGLAIPPSPIPPINLPTLPVSSTTTPSSQPVITLGKRAHQSVSHRSSEEQPTNKKARLHAVENSHDQNEDIQIADQRPIRFLFERLQKCKQTSVDIDFDCFLKTLEKSKRLQIINQYVIDYANFLKSDTSVISLKFTNLSICDETAKAIGEALKANKTIKELNIWAHQGKNYKQVMENLSDGLKANTGLVTLKLRNFSIRKHIKLLTEALETNGHIKHLDLTSSEIGDNVKVLLGALEKNSCLVSLNLVDNKINNEGVSLISEALKTNSSLRELDLRSNPITLSGLPSISGALKANHTLKKLHLKCSVDEFIEKILEEQTLFFRAYPSEKSKTESALSAWLNPFMDAVVENTSLISLNLTFNFSYWFHNKEYESQVTHYLDNLEGAINKRSDEYFSRLTQGFMDLVLQNPDNTINMVGIPKDISKLIGDPLNLINPGLREMIVAEIGY